MDKKEPNYQAFLLRGWQERPIIEEESPRWRFAIQEVFQPKRQFGFHNLDDLLLFLTEQFAPPNDATPNP